MIKNGLIKLTMVPLSLLMATFAHADQRWVFSELAKEGDLKFRYDVEENQTFKSERLELTDSGLKLRIPKDRHGTFSGTIPSMSVQGAQDHWEIVTTFSLPEQTGNYSGAYPSAGLVLFSNKKEYVSFGVVHNGGRNQDFVEIRFSDANESVRFNSFNTPFPSGSSKQYTLAIVKDPHGRIEFRYSNAEHAGVLLALADGNGFPARQAAVVRPSGGAFEGTPDYAKLYDFLSQLPQKQIGLFVDGHLYSVDNPDKAEFWAGFHSLEFRGITSGEVNE